MRGHFYVSFSVCVFMRRKIFLVVWKIWRYEETYFREDKCNLNSTSNEHCHGEENQKI